MREDDEDVSLQVTTLAGPVVMLMVPGNILVSEVRRMLQHNAECCYITQYNLVTSKGVVLSDMQQLNGQEGCSLKDCNHLKMVFTPYTQRAVREHILQIRALHSLPLSEMSLSYGNDEIKRTTDRRYPVFRKLTGLSAELAVTTGMRSDHQDVTKSFTSTLVSGPNLPLKGQDILSVISAADSYETPSQPLIGGYVSEPIGSAKLRGDLYYFTVSFEKTTWGIAAHRTGFYKLQSPDLRPPSTRPAPGDIFPTLLGLLSDIIPNQRERYEQLICLRVSHVCYEDHPIFPAVQWLGNSNNSNQVVHDSWKTTEHEIKMTQPHDPRTQIRNWMTLCGIPEVSPDQMVPDFLHTALDAVKSVIDGSLYGINPSDAFEDQVFYVNGIALSFCRDASEMNPSSLTPAWHQAHKDLALSKVITTAIRTGKVEQTIAPPPTCCIDYLGFRIWCMAYSSDMYNKYGVTQLASRSAVDPDLPIPADDPEIGAVLRSVTDAISLGRSDSLPNTSESLNGVRFYKSRDGRTFFENSVSLLAQEVGDDPLTYRVELLASSETETREHQSDGGSSFGTNELDSSHDGNSRSSSYLSLCNPQSTVSCLVDHQICQALVDVESVSFGDGPHLTQFLHERGIPLRCMSSLLRGMPANSSNRRIIVFEALIRSICKSLRSVMRQNRLQVSIPLLQFFNAIFSKDGSNELNTVLERCSSHFSIVDFPDWQSNSTDCWYILRGVCMKVGIQITARDYSFGKDDGKPLFRKSDFLDVIPLPCKCTSIVSGRSVLEAAQKPVDTGEELAQTGELSLEMLRRNDRTGCDKTMRVLLNEVCKAHGCDSPKVIPILFRLAANATAFLDFSRAASLYCRAASVARITSGPSSRDYKSAVHNFSLSLAKVRSPASLAIAHLTLSSHVGRCSEEYSLESESQALLDVITRLRAGTT
eukprot:TRINITY_DN10147_c0_g2_i1.p1 TRINITY_DN10147_c0_g2~~TRINITY_DN10147_c0_g2_i1.p1  ORF type:complete len:929 (+),score=142.80 TRINITY_DN10147_c0_g2_i1:52-2838(+)